MAYLWHYCRHDFPNKSTLQNGAFSHEVLYQHQKIRGEKKIEGTLIFIMIKEHFLFLNYERKLFFQLPFPSS